MELIFTSKRTSMFLLESPKNVSINNEVVPVKQQLGCSKSGANTFSMLNGSPQNKHIMILKKNWSCLNLKSEDHRTVVVINDG
jgi:hypothetical protein